MKYTVKQSLSFFVCLVMCLLSIYSSGTEIYATEESLQQDTYILGDVNGDKEIQLADAQLTLKAALKIIVLEPKLFQAADLLGDGQVTLEDARNVLLVALKIKTMDEVMGMTSPISSEVSTQEPVGEPSQMPSQVPNEEPSQIPSQIPQTTGTAVETTKPVTDVATQVPTEFDYEAYVNEYLELNITTDKDVYTQGEEIILNITVTNEGVFPIYMSEKHWKDNLSNINIQLQDANGSSIIDSSVLEPVSPMMFERILNPGECITVQRILPLSDELDKKYNGNLEQQEFSILATFRYTNSDWENTATKNYRKTFPLYLKKTGADVKNGFDKLG